MGMLGMRRNADLRTLAFTGFYFFMFFFTWTNFYSLRGWRYAVSWCTLAYFSFVGAVAVHNTIHCPVFYNKHLNKAFQIVLTLTYGHPVSNYVPGHNLSHHQNTQTARDVMRTTKLRFRWHFLNGFLFSPIIGIAMLGNDASYFNAQRALKRPIYKQMKLEQVILFTLAGVFLILDWYRWIFVALLPHVFAKYCIIGLNMLQHDGCDKDSPYNHSRNFISPLLNFFTYNNGFHGIHHLHPGWHWSILPRMHKIAVKPHMHPDLDQPSILGYMFTTFVYPGIRVDFKGDRLKLPPQVPDEEWFFDTDETYSKE